MKPHALPLGLLVLLIVAACGHRGPPLPPLPMAPRAPEQVRMRQEAGDLVINSRLTLRRLSGNPLRPPARLVLLVFAAPSAELARGWSPRSRDREFLRVARSIPLDPLPPDSTEGVAHVTRVPVERLGRGEAFVLALALEDRRGRSTPSQRRVLVPAVPPLPPPREARRAGLEQGVRIEWKLSADPRVRKVRLFRAVGTDAGFERLEDLPREAAGFTDHGARYGQMLRYAVAALGGGGEVPVESARTLLDPLEYLDRFPPAPARDLDAVGESGRIRVLWFPGGSADEAGSRIERQRRGDERWLDVGLVERPDTDFEDEAVDPDGEYRYRVITVDETGNRAPPVGPTQWVRPRKKRPRADTEAGQ